jgi:hypothetical protein
MQFRVIAVPNGYNGHPGLQIGDILTPTFYQHFHDTGDWYIETATLGYTFPNEMVEKIYPDPGYFQMDASHALSACAQRVNALITEAQDVRFGKDPDHLQDRQVEMLQCLQVMGMLLAVMVKEGE